MTAEIAVIGSINVDMVITGPRLPRPGETVIGDGFAMVPGGKGGNQAVAAGLAGGDVAFLGKVGDDRLGELARESLLARHIDPRHVLTAPATPTGVALINVDSRGENAIAVYSGANAGLSAADVSAFAPWIRGADRLLVQLEIPLDTVAAAVAVATAAGVPVVLNPAPAAPLDDALLSRVSILTPNESEAALLTGVQVGDDPAGARPAAEALAARGVETVIVTLGSRGAGVLSAGEWRHVPAFPVRAVDTVAAGDVFNGALVVALGEGLEIWDAVRFANAAAAIAVTRPGAQTSVPTRAEIDAFLASRGE